MKPYASSWHYKKALIPLRLLMPQQWVRGSAMVNLKMGAWGSQYKMTIIPLDDFDLILWIKFFMMANVALMPQLRGLIIMDDVAPNFV